MNSPETDTADRCAAAIMQARKDQGPLFREDVARICRTIIQADLTAALANAGKRPKKIPVSKMTEDEWFDHLKADPALAGIDILQQKDKCAFWCRERGRQFTRRAFTNWLLKADRTLSRAGCTAPVRLAEVADRRIPPPAGWQEFMRKKMKDWVDEYGSYEPPGSTALAQGNFFGMPKNWRDECRQKLAP